MILIMSNSVNLQRRWTVYNDKILAASDSSAFCSDKLFSVTHRLNFTDWFIQAAVAHVNSAWPTLVQWVPAIASVWGLRKCKSAPPYEHSGLGTWEDIFSSHFHLQCFAWYADDDDVNICCGYFRFGKLLLFFHKVWNTQLYNSCLINSTNNC